MSERLSYMHAALGASPASMVDPLSSPHKSIPSMFIKLWFPSRATVEWKGAGEKMNGLRASGWPAQIMPQTEGCNPHRLHGLGTASRGYFWEAPTFKAHSSTAPLPGQVLSVRDTSVFISYIRIFYLELQSALFDQSGK